MIIDENTTQNDINDGPMTAFNEGFLDYLFGSMLHQNPYKAYGDVDIDDPDYYLWYDGWNAALKRFPNNEPKQPKEDFLPCWKGEQQ